jgi:hypothetical protein
MRKELLEERRTKPPKPRREAAVERGNRLGGLERRRRRFRWSSEGVRV